MPSSECAGCLGCCGACAVFAAWVCWCVFGGFALSHAYDEASRCDGWLLWIATLLSVIYVPFGLLASITPCYVACADDDVGRARDVDEGEACLAGCMQGCLLGCANVTNIAFLFLDGFAIWTQQCMDEGLAVFVYAKVSFSLCAVALGTSVLVTLLARCRRD